MVAQFDFGLPLSNDRRYGGKFRANSSAGRVSTIGKGEAGEP
jgi:hypothetical protein